MTVRAFVLAHNTVAALLFAAGCYGCSEDNWIWLAAIGFAPFLAVSYSTESK